MQKVLSNLTRDERYKTLIQGLQATIVTLKRCYSFVAELSMTAGPYKDRLDEVKRILGSHQLSKLTDTDIYKDISVKTIAAYDYLLKNKLSADIKSLIDFISEVDVNIAVGMWPGRKDLLTLRL